MTILLLLTAARYCSVTDIGRAVARSDSNLPNRPFVIAVLT